MFETQYFLYVIFIILVVLTYLLRKKIPFLNKINLTKIISLTLNKIVQVQKLQITGSQKKKIVIQWILSTFENKILNYITENYGNIESFVQYIFQTIFKRK